MRRPRSLVGRSVSILWNRPSRWYYGEVVGYDARSGEHLVHYHDSDERWHDLGHEQRSGQLRHSPRSGRRHRAAWPSSEFHGERSRSACVITCQKWGKGLRRALEDIPRAHGRACALFLDGRGWGSYRVT